MSFARGDLEIDRQLSALSTALPFLLLITPVNVSQCRQRFLDGDFAEPQFEYRPLPNMTQYRRSLDLIVPDDAENHVLRHFFAALRRDLELRIDMLAERGTPVFRNAGNELFGHVEPALVDAALALLDLPVTPSGDGATIGGGELVRRFEAELDHYRQLVPTMDSTIQLREDTTGLVVSNGHLLIGADTVLRQGFVHSVAHHEVGVHILTHVNGFAQPLHTLGSGLARYDELQEALGLVAEYLAGGLRTSRLRILAARVIAAAHLHEDDTFAASFSRLRNLGLSDHASFTTTMRARRAGGLTKDAIYLRGLQRLLKHLGSGGTVDPLFLGKMSLEDLPLVEQLLDEGLLIEPPLRPRILDDPDAPTRLIELRRGMSVFQLGGFAT